MNITLPSGRGSVMAERGTPMDSLDYFPTPPWATRALLFDVLVDIQDDWNGTYIWEPAAGGGHMSEVLKETGAEVFASDVHDYGQKHHIGSFVGSGLDIAKCGWQPDWIITNPPFNLALDFALRAVDDAQVGVALLVRSVWAEGGKRYDKLFSKRPPSIIAQFCERVPMVQGRWDPKATTATSYAWFVWLTKDKLRWPTEFRWIPPGARGRHTKVDDAARFGGRGMSVQILVGDCRDVLKTLPDESVHCVVTSPPYFGLRNYGVNGAIGLEASFAAYMVAMMAVFREVRRVLRSDGTCWVNLGDAYCHGRGKDRRPTSTSGGRVPASWSNRSQPERIRPFGSVKTKDMLGIPWRVAFALQDDGWWLRSDIIWSKTNPMPESVTDRPTKAHEYLFMLSKSPRYFYDADAILEPVSPNTHARLSQDVANQVGSTRAHAGGKTNGNMKAVGRGPKTAAPGSGIKNNDSFAAAVCLPVTHRNKRTVWTVSTEAFKGAHFATFPQRLIEPCILAGCPQGGVVLDPFGGSGTTGLVADRLKRSAILIELNPAYAAMAQARIEAATMTKQSGRRHMAKTMGSKPKGRLPLFEERRDVETPNP